MEKRGWIEETMEDYINTEALSSSDLVKFMLTPAHYRDSKPFGPKASAHGTAIHSAFLDGIEDFEQRLIMQPNAPWRGKEKEKYWLPHFQNCHERGLLKISVSTALSLYKHELLNAYNRKAIILDGHTKRAILGVRDRVFGSKTFSELVVGQRETSGYVEIDGVLCKCRPDVRKKTWLVNLKTISDPIGAIQHIRKFYYDIRAAWECIVAKQLGYICDSCVWLFMGYDPPYGVQAKYMSLNSDEYKTAEEYAWQCFDLYKKCKETNNWPCYEDTIDPVEHIR